MSYYLSEIIKELRPNSRYSIVGQVLKWKDETTSKPTDEEIEAKRLEILQRIPYEKLRNERNILLKNSDIYSLPDFPHSSDTKRQEWITYRQALRDITTTQTPQIDEYGNLTNITWPTPPS